MIKRKELFIATKRDAECYYAARCSEDEHSVIIQRIVRANGKKYYHTLMSFVDCGGYIFSAIEIDEKQYSVASRIPSAEYWSDIPDEYAKYRDCFVECVTDSGNILRIHVDDIDAKAGVFNKFVVTEVCNGKELAVAYVDIDEANELGVILSGYPAGYEVA